MINTLTIITDDYSLLEKSNPRSNENILISFAINLDHLSDNLRSIYCSLLLKDPNVFFSFFVNDSSFNSSNDWMKKNKNLLLQFFFHPQYKSVNGKPLFFFNEEKSETVEIKKAISFFDHLLTDQGYSGIQAVYFTNDRVKIKENICYYFDSELSSKETESGYFELLKNNLYVSKYIGVKTNNIDKTLDLFSSSENLLRKENLVLFRHLDRYNDLEKSELALQRELSFIKSDLENQKTYLEFFKNNDETLKINEFYRNEYEILPLWYKKFGHIIKVLMGKRSFRSLFDNDVNKYKN